MSSEDNKGDDKDKAIEAILTVYPVSRKNAETALAKALESSPFTLTDYANLFTDPDRNPLPEALRMGYGLESVLDVITKLAMMLGRPDMRQVAEELKALWVRRPSSQD